jgi:hypothetical protein
VEDKVVDDDDVAVAAVDADAEADKGGIIWFRIALGVGLIWKVFCEFVFFCCCSSCCGCCCLLILFFLSLF